MYNSQKLNRKFNASKIATLLFMSILLSSVPLTAHSEQRVSPKTLSVIKTNEVVKYNNQDLMCMARNIYYEAKSEPALGKFAVAQVTINRMRHPKYTNTICSVVMAKNQFSWTRNSKLRYSTPVGKLWDESFKVARLSLEDGMRISGMERALFFHARHARPGWDIRGRLAQIGSNIFYAYI